MERRRKGFKSSFRRSLSATQWLEGIDILINLAGVLQGASLELDEFPDEVWESV
ncbi:MAG: hypothetical protein Ct9H90mP2_13750 [Dehalococcoidia bacterium]|nr:MAG: hypothetical protein Ct9H90mP2_13750 [Dehalococcoidia bacterium]